VRAEDRTRILEAWVRLVHKGKKAWSEPALQRWGQALLEATEQFLYGRTQAIEEAVFGLLKAAPAGSVSEKLDLLLRFRRAAFGVLSSLSPADREALEEAFDRAALVVAAWHDGGRLPSGPTPAFAEAGPAELDLTAFHLILPVEIQRSLRYGRPLSLLLIHLDPYDDLASLHGPETAERAMEALLALLHRALRSSDVRYRIGPGQVAVLLPETGPEEALVAAERVRERAASADPFGAGPDSCTLRVTIGVASCPEHATEAGNLLRRAEQALENARRMGGNLSLVCRL
jgi:diguanylate cyclase (GGDEF)-like protein